MKELIRKYCWNLRADPFYPEIGPDSAPLSLDAYERDLNPKLDSRVLSLFFDVYEWKDSVLIGDISPKDGLQRFPDAHTLRADAPLMVIASGAGQTGLNSLANLVVFKAEQAWGREALQCRVQLGGRDALQNLPVTATRLIHTVKYVVKDNDMANEMKECLNDALQLPLGDSDTSYRNIFETFGTILQPLKRKVFIWIYGGGDPDSWGRIYQCVRDCADCVIVTTPFGAAARTCYQALSTSSANANVCWVRAKPLDRVKTHEFVKARLKDVRLGAASPGVPLLPFTADAIDALFERGSAALSGGAPAELEFPIGWIRQTLHRVIVDRIEELQNANPGADTATLAAMPANAIAINAAMVKRARDKLNGGTS